MKHQTEIAYISGAITHDPNYKAKFADAEMVLDHLGYRVINPCILPEGLRYHEYIDVDLLLVEVADTIIMLPDWKHSDGATLEHDHAAMLKKRIIDYRGIGTESPLAAKEAWKDLLENS